MLLRKLIAALFSSVILAIGLLFINIWEQGEGIGLGILVLFLSLIGNYLYGVPVSFLSELLTKRLLKTRVYVAGFIYMLMAYITVFMIEAFAFFSIICALLFFFIDEGIKVVKDTPNNKNNKLLFLKLLSVIPFAALAFWGVDLQTDTSIEETNSNYLFLIPEGYEGSIVVITILQTKRK